MKTTTKLFFVILLVVLSASVTFGQPRLRPETPAEREQRLLVRQQYQAVVDKMAARAKANTATAPVQQASGINVTCAAPVYIANWSIPQLQWLCDASGRGSANIVGNFFATPEGTPVALAASPDGYLFTNDGSGTVYRLTDTMSRGTADSAVEYPGVAWSQRLFAASGSDLMSEDDFRSRLFHYSLSSGGHATNYPAKSLPSLEQGLVGVVISSVAHTLFAINEYSDQVIAQNFYNGQLQGQPTVVFSGNQINTLAFDDQTGVLFVSMSGTCNNPPLPEPPTAVVSGTSGSNGAQPCLLPSIWGIRIVMAPFNSGPMLNLIASGDKLDLYYTTNSFPMAVVGGKLLVTSIDSSSDPQSPSQVILQYDYQQALRNGGPVVPTVFADKTLLGQYGFVGSMTAFKGGPVANVPQLPIP